MLAILLNPSTTNKFLDNILDNNLNDIDIDMLTSIRQLVDPEVISIVNDLTLDDLQSLPIITSELIDPRFTQAQLNGIESYYASIPLSELEDTD